MHFDILFVLLFPFLSSSIFAFITTTDNHLFLLLTLKILLEANRVKNKHKSEKITIVLLVQNDNNNKWKQFDLNTNKNISVAERSKNAVHHSRSPCVYYCERKVISAREYRSTCADDGVDIRCVELRARLSNSAIHARGRKITMG